MLPCVCVYTLCAQEGCVCVCASCAQEGFAPTGPALSAAVFPVAVYSFRVRISGAGFLMLLMAETQL